MKTAKVSTSSVGERWQVVIPKAIRENLGMKPKMKIEFRIENATIVMTPKRDVSHLRAAAKKWGGKGRAQLLKDGFNSVDEYIEAIRGR
jgi:AbrB family looped-hinge helix DNA binding protein